VEEEEEEEEEQDTRKEIADRERIQLIHPCFNLWFQILLIFSQHSPFIFILPEVS
jgi:hypothetical protein